MLKNVFVLIGEGQSHLLGGQARVLYSYCMTWPDEFDRTNFLGVMQSDTDFKIKFQYKKVQIDFKLDNILIK